MRLSVVFICHNQADLLPRSLAALLAQRDQIDEIYLVDNASSDGSLRRLQAAAPQFRSAHVLANPTNIGAVAALNACLTMASGDCVYFAAADDFVLPGFLATHLSMFKLYPKIGLSSCLSRLSNAAGGDSGIFPSPMPRVTPGPLSPEECRQALYGIDHWFMGNATVFSRAKLAAIGGFRPEFAGFSDAFCCFTLALRHGAAFSPQAMAAKRTIELGMGSAVHADKNEAARLWESVERHMTTDFPELYDPALRARLRRRWHFNTARADLWRRLAAVLPPGLASAVFLLGRAGLLLWHKPFDVVTVLTRRRRAAAVSLSGHPV